MRKAEFEGTVVIMAANPWDGLRMADRQLAESLCRHAPVLYVDPPVSAMTFLRDPARAQALRGSRLRRLAPGLARLIPQAAPGLSRRGIAPLNARLIAAQARHSVRRLGGTIHSVVDADVLLSIMGRCGEQVSLYWAQDDFVGLASLIGLDPARLARAERRMVRRSDVVVAANPVVAESVSALGRDPALIPFGCDYDHFAKSATVEPALDVTLEQPMAVFMGQIGDRIDVEILRAVVDRGVRLLIVGPKQQWAHGSVDELLSRPNVEWVGERPFEALPSYLAHAALGLLPYNHSRFNVGSFPLKTLEYLAAGLPVVATSLPAISWLNTAHIVVSDSPGAFADAVTSLLERAPDDGAAERRREFARGHTWDARAEAFAKTLGLNGRST